MSKSSKRRLVRLNQVRPAYEEAVGTKGGQYPFVGNDDAEYSFPHPAFMPKELRAELDDADDEDEIARILLGEQYEKFIKGGNDVEDLMLLFQNVGAEYRGKADKVRISRS